MIDLKVTIPIKHIEDYTDCTKSFIDSELTFSYSYGKITIIHGNASFFSIDSDLLEKLLELFKQKNIQENERFTQQQPTATNSI